MSMNVKFPEIQRMSGKGAMFIRAFMEAFYDGERGLRQCQEADQTAVKDDGGEISIPYISKLSKTLVAERIVGRRKVGRHYTVTESNFTQDFKDFLEEHDRWGLDANTNEQDFSDKVSVMAHLKKYHCIRSTNDNLIPRSGYKMLMEAVKAGKYEIAFIPAGVAAGVKVDGKTFAIKPLELIEEEPDE